MDKGTLKNIIDVAAGRKSADLCIENCKIVDVFNKEVFEGSVLIKDGCVAGFGGEGFPKALSTFDAKGKYLAPGFIDSHVHIESSHCSPAEFSRLVVPCGTTTVIADPHEICNVCGVSGLDYMLKASENVPLSVFLQFPSCVPATPFENAGAILTAKEVATRIDNERVLGLGELMDYVGTAAADDGILDKLMVAKKAGKVVDGHSPAIVGSTLDAYSASGVMTDHECATGEELRERLRRGIYVLLRQGTSCHDVLNLLKGVDEKNYNRCLFCTDDRQAVSILTEGHIDNNIRIAIGDGLDPITAITMATINAATCYNLRDRGAVAPGYRADLVLIDSLENFQIQEVFIKGEHVASKKNYLVKVESIVPENVRGMVNVKNFSEKRLEYKPKSSTVKTIEIIPGSVVTKIGQAKIDFDEEGRWVRNSDDVVKVAVVERHHGTGNVGVALLQGYGLKGGAIATSVAHDSHNIIVAGDNDHDMAVAVSSLVQLGGGMVVVKDGQVVDSFGHEIAGLMTNFSAEEVAKRLEELHEIALNTLHINSNVDPFMTLCFMSLPVIPAIKLTDMGLFDVTQFKFINPEV